MTHYADTPDKWATVARSLRVAGLCGLDSETYGHDVRETTAPYRAKIHVWSVAVSGPSGVVGCVLPQAALGSPEIVAVLQDPTVKKIAHNAPHDVHAFLNHGIEVAGWADSLGRARLTFPEEQGHGLKKLCGKVGMTLREYKEVLAAPNWVEMTKKVRVCECEAHPCRKRGKGHERVDKFYTDMVLRGTRLLPLEEVVPGHPKWAELLAYAEEDAVCALKLWLLMDQRIDQAPPPADWLVV